MEIDVAVAAAEIRSIGKADEGKSIDEFLGGIGLGAVTEQLKDLRLGGSQGQPGMVTGVDLDCLVPFLGCGWNGYLVCPGDGCLFSG